MPTLEIPTLETPRLRLRAFREEDTEPLLALFSDREVVQYLGDRSIPGRQDVWRSIAGWLGHWVMRGYGVWAVEERETGDLVGRIGLMNPADWPGPEVGYVLGKRWWGRGYATEGARAAMDWGFENVGFEELISLIDPANAASIAVATRLGEGHRSETELRGHRVLVYAITRSEWMKRGDPPRP